MLTKSNPLICILHMFTLYTGDKTPSNSPYPSPCPGSSQLWVLVSHAHRMRSCRLLMYTPVSLAICKCLLPSAELDVGETIWNWPSSFTALSFPTSYPAPIHIGTLADKALGQSKLPSPSVSPHRAFSTLS